jgi:hypothetical protein
MISMESENDDIKKVPTLYEWAGGHASIRKAHGYLLRKGFKRSLARARFQAYVA